MLNVSEYLARLGMKPFDELSPRYLADLHLAHLEHIPYENFDIINQLDFSLDPQFLFHKIITCKRGGFCYELNVLFLNLLNALGFQATLMTAQIIAHDGIIGPEFDHPLILVVLNERWLVDVGNIKWFTVPLNIDNEKTQIEFGKGFVVECKHDLYTLYQTINNTKVAQYQFKLKEVNSSDFLEICQAKWTTPNSKFTTHYIISKILKTNRIILKNNLILNISNEKQTQETITNINDFRWHLANNFGSRYLELVKNYR